MRVTAALVKEDARVTRPARSSRSRLVARVALLAALVAVWIARPSGDVGAFQANPATLGAIPDYPSGQPSCHNASVAIPKNVTFQVTGLAGRVRSVKVSFTLNPGHTWVGDLWVTLVSPGGARSQLILSQTGSTTAGGIGDDSDATGPYTFYDNAAAPPSGGWWQEATAAGAMTALVAGHYRTTAPGGNGAVNPAPATIMSTAFAGIDASGTWTLRFLDGCTSDTGSVSAATLIIASSVTVLDHEGNGNTDFTVVRDLGSPIQTTWYTLNSNGFSATPFGLGSTDSFLSGDYTGDGRADIVVWRPGSPSVFYILNSLTGALISQPFGQTGDDWRIGGDYDADGKVDIAVYRAGAGPGQPSFWHILRSLSGYVARQWGQFGDKPAPGDYNGDGLADVAVRRDAGGGATVFYLDLSAAGYESVLWGAPGDGIAPGDYDGDGRTDITAVRAFGGAIFWYIRRSTDGGMTVHQFGTPGPDFLTQGDYDGDGKTDVAVWRSSATPGQSAFYVWRSSTSTLLVQQWGQGGDYPVANFNVH